MADRQPTDEAFDEMGDAIERHPLGVGRGCNLCAAATHRAEQEQQRADAAEATVAACLESQGAVADALDGKPLTDALDGPDSKWPLAERVAALRSQRDAAEALCGELTAAARILVDALGEVWINPRTAYERERVRLAHDAVQSVVDLLARTPTQAAERLREYVDLERILRKWFQPGNSRGDKDVLELAMMQRLDALARLDAAGGDAETKPDAP